MGYVKGVLTALAAGGLLKEFWTVFQQNYGEGVGIDLNWSDPVEVNAEKIYQWAMSNPGAVATMATAATVLIWTVGSSNKSIDSQVSNALHKVSDALLPANAAKWVDGVVGWTDADKTAVLTAVAAAGAGLEGSTLPNGVGRGAGTSLVVDMERMDFVLLLCGVVGGPETVRRFLMALRTVSDADIDTYLAYRERI